MAPQLLTTIEQAPAQNQRIVIGSIRSSEKNFTGGQKFKDDSPEQKVSLNTAVTKSIGSRSVNYRKKIKKAAATR